MNRLDKLARFFRNSPDMKPNIPPVLIIFALVCFALVHNTQAVSPPPDGGYPVGNTAEGQNALLSLTSGTYNTAVGLFSLKSITTARFNTAIGAGTLFANTADRNTAIGVDALYSNTRGTFNTASGAFSLFYNTTGSSNTAIGDVALFSNTTGYSNTANGAQALFSNTIGYENTANGAIALFYNTTGNWNTATGLGALHFNTTGFENTAVGTIALFYNTTGAGNTAVGVNALFNNRTGTNNTAIGAGALSNNDSGGGNIALGDSAGTGVTAASDVICIGPVAGGDVSNSCFIGNVYNTTTVSGTTLPVIVSDQGQLGTTPSSRRFKNEIKPMDSASETILALKPVTFHYKSDAAKTPQFGLIAEEVAAVNPDLVVRDTEGKPYTVRYDQVNAMLLNEFLKEHRTVEEQKATIAQLKQDFQSKLAHQQNQIEALTAGLQKVSAQLEASKPAPQVVNNP
jgi:hypothetical protein